MSSETPPTIDETPVIGPAYDPYERPGLVIAYVVGTHPIRKGTMVGLDAEGLLVPISKATCFVGISNDRHPGSPQPAPNAIANVTVTGSFVFGFKGWEPDYVDLHRPAWAFDETTVGGAPYRTDLVVGRIVAIERTVNDRGGVRIKIDEAASKCLPPLPGRIKRPSASTA